MSAVPESSEPRGVVLAGCAPARAAVALQGLSHIFSVALTAWAGVVRLSSKYCGIT